MGRYPGQASRRAGVLRAFRSGRNTLQEAALGARFVGRLPGFLRRRVTLEEARATLARRLMRRQADFLALADRAIYQNAGSPYLALLRQAGCEYGDLEQLVRQEGLEGTLRALYRQGVYLTVDEIKGRRAVVRGSATLHVDPSRLRNPGTAAHLLGQSSGSRGVPATASVDLATLRDWAVNFRLYLHARGATHWQHARWAVPGATTVIALLMYGVVGQPLARAFTQVNSSAGGIHPRYAWSERAIRWVSALAGVPVPRPTYVPMDDPLPVARWIADILRSGGVPLLATGASPAVRLCQAAAAARLDLAGAQLTLQGEPTTSARLETVRGAGMVATTQYGSMECGTIGYGCQAPASPDDMHFFHDLYAAIQPGGGTAGPDLPARTLLMTSLRSTAHMVLVNASLGDQAEIVERACGCPFEAAGWTTHLHTIRSFEKLTTSGMTFRDADVIRVLDEVLPARFGGGPTHYQLLEEEDAGGGPRLRLLVHPAVGPLDTAAVADAFLAALEDLSDAYRVMVVHWRTAGLVQVDRQPPRATGGKILHLLQAAR